MNATDRDALTRAMAACRARGAANARQLDAKLADESWVDVAEFAAYSAQIDALGLMPWQSPRRGRLAGPMANFDPPDLKGAISRHSR